MQVRQRLLGDVAVVELEGKLDVGEGDEALAATIEGLAKDGCVRLVLDLGQVTHADTTCLGLLVAGYVRLRRQGGSLKLLRTPARIREVLAMARLTEVLVTYDSEAQAVASFAAP